MVTQIYWRESVRGASTEQDWLSQHQSWYTWAGWGRGREERGRPTCLVGQEPAFSVTLEADPLPRPHVTEQTMDGLDCAMSPHPRSQNSSIIPLQVPGPQLTSGNLAPSPALPCGSPHPLLSLPFQVSMA